MTEPLLSGFPAMVDENCDRLVLGSMPGVQSLNAVEYYAHPQNAFWWIIESCFGITRQLDYQQRCQQLVGRGVGLWDVVGRCRRPGSLDSAIDPVSIEVNDFASLLTEHAGIQLILLNGGKAAELWRRRVVPTLGESAERIRIEKMPSTSPAYAAMSREKKLAIWKAALFSNTTV